MKPRLPGRALPPQFKHEYKFSWFRRLTLKERLKLLFGFNLQFHVHWLTAHSAGHCQPVIKAVVTKQINAEQQFLSDNMEAIQPTTP